MSINSSIQSLYWIDTDDNHTPFPPVEQALTEPDGLLAFGANLSVPRLLEAYSLGIFPWYSAGQPIMWWSPDPRAVLLPEQLKISRSLAKTLRKGQFTVTLDKAFEAVIKACAQPRESQPETWITTEMQAAYNSLHTAGYAHSVECWFAGELVGGLYGVAIGRVFFGESMFSWRSDASKIAMVSLVQQLKAWGFTLIDCQVQSDHLCSLGATTWPRARFTQHLRRWCNVAPRLDAVNGQWQFDESVTK